MLEWLGYLLFFQDLLDFLRLSLKRSYINGMKYQLFSLICLVVQKL